MQQGGRPWALALLINWAPAELGKGTALLIRHWSLLIRGRVRWSLRRATSVLYYIDKYLWCISYWQTIVFFISLTCSLSLCLTNMCGFIWYIILTSRPSMSIVQIYTVVSMLLQTRLATSKLGGAMLVKAIYSIYLNIYDIFQCISCISIYISIFTIYCVSMLLQTGLAICNALSLLAGRCNATLVKGNIFPTWDLLNLTVLLACLYTLLTILVSLPELWIIE